MPHRFFWQTLHQAVHDFHDKTSVFSIPLANILPEEQINDLHMQIDQDKQTAGLRPEYQGQAGFCSLMPYKILFVEEIYLQPLALPKKPLSYQQLIQEDEYILTTFQDTSARSSHAVLELLKEGWQLGQRELGLSADDRRWCRSLLGPRHRLSPYVDLVQQTLSADLLTDLLMDSTLSAKF